MKKHIPEKLKAFAEAISVPLYIVGGRVRNYIIDGSGGSDFDVAAPLSAEKAAAFAESAGLTVVADYRRTQTVVFSDGAEKYEYTAFREEKYPDSGAHTPTEVILTGDIEKDAKRRDFKCNAVYYDIKKDEIVDPLGGVADIKNKRITTVIAPEKVFKSDGLRLMRLARFSGELNFTPSADALAAAREFSGNIKDVSKERVVEELRKILVSDLKYSFSDKRGHYTALEILSDTRVLDCIFPELTLGRGMEQRADYHDYDVLEHSLKSVLYAPIFARLSALFHDVGKPYCKLNYGKYHGHDAAGAKIVAEIFTRFKFSAKEKEDAVFVAQNHMKDLKGDMRECKVRRFIVENYDKLPLLRAVMQADYSACKDDLSTAPTLVRWDAIIEEMKKSGAPFGVKDLKITARDVIAAGYTGKEIGETLKNFLFRALDDPSFNDREKMLLSLKK